MVGGNGTHRKANNENGTAKAFQKAIYGTVEGDRHNAAASYAGKILHDLKDIFNPTELEIRRQQLRSWNQTNEPPLPCDEVDRIFADIHAKEAERRVADKVVRPCTDLGNAERFADQHRGTIGFVHPWKKWFSFDGKRWKSDDSGEAVTRAKQTVRSIYAEANECGDDDKRKKLATHAGRSESKERIVAMLVLAQSELPIDYETLDNHPWLFNVQNGTLDLRTGKLREHRLEDFLTQISPVEYDPTAKAPIWESTLNTIFAGNVELIRYVPKLLGYCLTGVTTEQILSIFHGNGANGKSTVLNAFMDILGDGYAMKATPDLIMQRKGESHPTERADLFKKRFVAAIETEDGRKLSESLVKELTGGDKIRARRMREDFWQFDPTHKLLVCTNYVPDIRGTDHAIWRRLRLIPFSVILPDDQQDKQLPEKLRAETAGILAWCVCGCLAWQQEGLGSPECVTKATADYKVSEDVIGEFIGDHYTLGTSISTRHSSMLSHLNSWVTINGREATFTGKALSRYLCQNLGLKSRRSNGKIYDGIGLKSVLERSEGGGGQ